MANLKGFDTAINPDGKYTNSKGEVVNSDGDVIKPTNKRGRGHYNGVVFQEESGRVEANKHDGLS